ncbi:phosphotransferase [Streptomyces filamentosus]|uniref:Phosphotransferase n=1 Tax=Streptomyces filamentosus TaxID=67294 RepID=A0A919BYP6_STRFL|nr:phosphotransferase [Streptomyces filamentosus]GHG26772.1 phosphotransferase [Streptomyces filamentosus]
MRTNGGPAAGAEGVETVVDRGRFPDAVTPWDDGEWRRETLGWAGEVLAGHGLAETGPREVRVRPWSVLVRFRTGGGGRDAVWLKAGAPSNAFEAGLAGALAAWVPEHVMAPLAVDAGRGLALLPDGGPLFRGLLDEGAAGPGAWTAALGRYAEMQRRLVPYADRLGGLGVPGARTRDLPDAFDALVAANPLFDADERAALLRRRPLLVELCAELDAYGLPDSLDHCDLHDGQILSPAPGRFTFFDWGDASVAHPFGSLLVPFRAVRERYGPGHAAAMVDAYLERWSGLGPSAAELRRAAALAVRLAALGRAGTWFRLFPGTPLADSHESSAYWLRELFAGEWPPVL